MVIPVCECGCGAQVGKRRRGRWSRFRQGHNARIEGARGHYSKGGRMVSKEGYILIRNPRHPRASKGYVPEHVLIAEKALGRILERKHPVHHHDGNPANNESSNLVICEDQAYHLLLHARMRAIVEGRNPNLDPLFYYGRRWPVIKESPGQDRLGQ